MEKDLENLAGCLRGDRISRNAFVHRFAPLVARAVKRILGSSPIDPALSVEDLVQDVFLKIFRSDAALLRRFDPEKASLSTWIALIARSTALDAGRKRRLRTVPLDGQAIAEKAPAGDESSATLVLPPGILPPRQKLVLTLLFDRGWEVSRVGSFLGISEQTVRSTKHKALERLREVLAETPVEGGAG